MGTVDFYHYTNADSASKIIKSGTIFESSSGGLDANFGTGVYGTKLPPSAGKRAIASNNWAGGWDFRECKGDVDFGFKIQIPKQKVAEYILPDRHVYCHPGKIKLSSYSWELYEV